jgi:LPS sulfotransferase NodH
MQKARYDSYIICTSPRSGSTLLCKLLAATGRTGNPDSHFHEPSLASWLESFALSRADFASEREALSAVFEAARRYGTGDTGLFGLRLQRGSFDFFMQQAGILYPNRKSDLERIQAAFGKTLLIHLTRANKLDQAISCVKAEQTGLWHRAPDGTELERLSAPREPFYDAAEIARHLAEFAAFDAAWKDWFEREKVRPLQLSYDELALDPAGVLARVLDELGLDRAMARNIGAPVARLADATNRLWADRFLEERKGSGGA